VRVPFLALAAQVDLGRGAIDGIGIFSSFYVEVFMVIFRYNRHLRVM